jgi:hypothetical protein
MATLGHPVADDYSTVSVNVVLCVSDPLEAVTVTVKFPVGVPLTTLKSTAAGAPPPGVELVTTTGKLLVVARSFWPAWRSRSTSS